jgi:hypothetical protein
MDGAQGKLLSEVVNNSNQATGLGSVLKTAPTSILTSFGSALPARRYFQYRAWLVSDDEINTCDYGSGATVCSPDLKSVTISGPDYDPSAPWIQPQTALTFSSLSQLEETLGAGGCSAGLGYALSLDQVVWYWWNGSAWVVSDQTVAQTSNLSAFNFGLSRFHTDVGSGSVYLRAYLKSNGSTPCEVDRLRLFGNQ